MQGELVPVGGGDTIPLPDGKLLVGRRSHCDICLKFNNVSSQHCELEFRDGYWHIRDLGSSNGTKVNGVRIETKCLMPGDEVMVSKHAFNIQYDVDPNAATPEDENPFDKSLMERAGLSQGPRSSRGSNRSGSRSPRKTSSKENFLMEWLNDE